MPRLCQGDTLTTSIQRNQRDEALATAQLLRHTSLPAFKSITPNLLHLQNYLGTPFGITWTLAVEEHFYLILPIVFLLLLRFYKQLLVDPKIMLCIALGLVVFRNFLRCLNLFKPFGAFTHVAYTHLRIDSLFWGVFLGYIYHFYPQRLTIIARHRWLRLCVGCICVVPMTFIPEETPFVWTVGFTLLYFGYGLICLCAVCHSESDPLLRSFFASRAAKAVAFVGFYSYSIYLWHANTALYFLGYRFGKIPSTVVPDAVLWPGGMILYICTAITVGFLLSKLIEMPMLTLRNKLFPARSDALPDQTPESAQQFSNPSLWDRHVEGAK